MIGVSFVGYDGKKKEAVAHSVGELDTIMSSMNGVGSSRRGVRNTPSAASSAPMSFERTDPVDGPLVGVEGNDSMNPDGMQRPVGASGGWRVPVTRTEMEVRPSVEMKCNEVVLVKLQYDLVFSEKGFCKGRTTERKVWEKKFFVLSEGAASGKYGVRAVTNESGHITDLLFGDDESLSGSVTEVMARSGVAHATCSPCPAVGKPRKAAANG